MGASTFDTSLTFFTKRYEQVCLPGVCLSWCTALRGASLWAAPYPSCEHWQAGVLFDEVWAWEMAAYQPACALTPGTAL